MKESSRIRIFVFVGIILLIGIAMAAFAAGYRLSLRRMEERQIEIARERAAAEEAEQKKAAAEEETEEDAAEAASLETARQEEHVLFIIKENSGYLEVYLADGVTLYMPTDITPAQLDEEMRQRLDGGIEFYSINALYEFLESYSS